MSVCANIESSLVSIGMPVFNGCPYLEEALQSLINQDYKNIEIIISDNSSVDGTQSICKSYADSDNRIKYIRQASNIGGAENFLYVLGRAQGEFFMWAAHDDVWQKNWVSTLVSKFKETDVSLRGKVAAITESGEQIETIKLTNFKRRGFIKAYMQDERMGRAFYIYGIFKRQHFYRCDLSILKGDRACKDIDFVCHSLAYGDMRTISDTTQYYRIRKNSAGAMDSIVENPIRRAIYHVYPFKFYVNQAKVTPWPYNIILLILAPVKHIKSQVELWIRGFRRHVFGKNFI